ncbi:serine hydrolase [Cytobacillus solani]|uniref:D-alanyl-D-alanine carboxypeptidase n=1 Tax=Cytobacillus solani TaxID=1637975 RepID=A0A0Q3QNE2_9BACI|nr:serine hydrolase [Cytobacillus solani]KQL19665.1 D-alanyl-D-alanine carboxypeptidase [Cytobacillus solani]USK52896.1 class A beta-lactamase-related serine hydrolase [Cytobacillus solani]
MKILFWLIIGIVALFGIVIGIGILKYKKEIKGTNPEYIIDLFKEKAKDNNISLSIHHNNEKWVEINEKKLLPLASTVKIIVAIEYAQQVAEGRVDPKKEVSLQELDAYYVPKTDGGAHKAWLSKWRSEKDIDHVPLSEVAKGMIDFSSNANTDYLMQILGLENINRVAESLGITNHEPLYPIVSALFIPSRLMTEKKLSKIETLQELKQMDLNDYRNWAIAIHKHNLSQPLTSQEKQQLIKVMNMDFQKIWSDRLTRSTTEAYASIMRKLNSKEFFHKNVHEHLDPIMEQLMRNPINREWLQHAGQKGGSTAFVFTMAMYATDKDGNQTELAFFANDLTLIEQTKLSCVMNEFQLKFLKDSEFRKLIKSELAHL